MTQPAWYRDWFSSPYYPLLYRHRDDREADLFVSHLLTHLNIAPGYRVLDLACGRGRHARILAKAGLEVVGLDLSEASILEARAAVEKNDRLEFFVHDMREPFPCGNFHYVFNLFTSFGYFDGKEENRKILRNIYHSLNPGGRIVLDYFNIQYVRKHLIAAEEKTENGVLFEISREEQAGRVLKRIRISDPAAEGPIEYTEQVQIIDFELFTACLDESGFVVEEVWGDYHGRPFDAETSPRMVLFARRPR